MKSPQISMPEHIKRLWKAMVRILKMPPRKQLSVMVDESPHEEEGSEDDNEEKEDDNEVCRL